MVRGKTLTLGLAAAAFGLASLAAGTDAATAASACKGLTESGCKGQSTCAWVAPKTGKQKPYCRTKAAKKSKK